jgi:2-amino-4-hydroxy-6-hydroxymethyldihydropteridine diphosphokinase
MLGWRVIAIVGLGSNLGDRLETIRSAIAALARAPGLSLEAVSDVYETPAVGPPQPSYLNAAARIATSLSPEELMAALLAIEADHGRVRREKWGPRTLDLDVLVILDEEGTLAAIETGAVIAPHPRLTERSFALAPLLDVAPELAPRFGPALEAVGGAPPRAQGSQSIVVPGRHR